MVLLAITYVASFYKMNLEMFLYTAKVNSWEMERVHLVVQMAWDFHIYIYVCIRRCILAPGLPAHYTQT